MTRYMNRFRIALLVVTAALAACEKNTVQTLPFEPPQNTRIKFFNFGVNAPQVNFYADAIKMTAVQSGTGVEANTGVAYGGAGDGGVYLSIAAGSHALTGRIAAATDKDLPIAMVTASLADGKFYSFYQSGFYNTTAKTIDAFLIEDPVTAPADYTCPKACTICPRATPIRPRTSSAEPASRSSGDGSTLSAPSATSRSRRPLPSHARNWITR